MRTRFLALTLVAFMAVGMTPALAKQANGMIGGKATDAAKQPYSDYNVQLRDISSGQIVGTVPLNAQGQFTFNSLQLSRRFLVELYSVKANHVVCTEGPFMLNNSVTSKTDVNIDCGKTPAALWLLAAGAGTAAAVALGVRSPSR
jgi:hypothetical protein